MSKLSFRARALDAAKPLPVYRHKEVPDLNDCVSISRAVPQMPTGMEKEEELEHHLQRAMSAQQVFRDKKDHMVIPVPQAETNTTYYDRLYRGDVRIPKHLIHIQSLALDLELPDYDMDSEDETVLNRLNRRVELRPLQFETMVDRLEKASTHQLVTLPEAKLLLKEEEEEVLKLVYDHWVRKRSRGPGPSLMSHIKQERRDGSTNNDPYVAFRRRTEKMQTRKNRKNDEASYEKMLRLRREFSRTVTILEMIKRREKSKRELLHLTLEVVERRYQMADFSGDTLREVSLPLVEKPLYSVHVPVTLNTKPDGRIKKKQQQVSLRELSSDLIRPKKRKRERLCPPQKCPGRPPGVFSVNQADIKQYDFHSSGDEDSPSPPLSPPSSDDEENQPDGVFVFRRTAGCRYLSPWTEQEDAVDLPELLPRCRRYFLTELTLPPNWTGLCRRRIGRGGRVILDRASSCLDPGLKRTDSVTPPVCRTRTRTCIPEQRPTLTRILHDIQTLRRFCYRPRTVQDLREGDTRTASSVEVSKPAPDNKSGPGESAGGITEEQYHSHQQQLVQMQKQQLKQLQINTAPCRTAHIKSSRSTESSSKTLDCARAQFAASAVISSGLGPLSSDNKSHKASVNGVHHPPGSSRTPCSSLSSHSRMRLQSLPGHRAQVGPVTPPPPHTARPSALPTSALRLATATASVDRVPKVSTARDSSEPDRLLNGLSEATLPMEVT
ncbi:uncharacterized protein V6R79_020363 [Siganus canaliculatus]